jgi:ABC-2 type transport system ATP-binding protein
MLGHQRRGGVQGRLAHRRAVRLDRLVPQPGAGKSTMMRLILGLDAPTSGSVTVNGRPYAAWRRPLLEVGALLEAKAFHGGRSAYNHLLCLALSNGIGRARVEQVLELVGLRSVARKRAGDLHALP